MIVQVTRDVKLYINYSTSPIATDDSHSTDKNNQIQVVPPDQTINALTERALYNYMYC